MIRRPPRSTLSSSSAASDVYKRQLVFLGVLASTAMLDLALRAPLRPIGPYAILLGLAILGIGFIGQTAFAVGSGACRSHRSSRPVGSSWPSERPRGRTP